MTSLRSRILHRTLQRVISALDMDLTIQEQRTRFDELARRGIRLPRGVTARSVQAGGVHAEWIEPIGIEGQKAMLYLHGGGYCLCSLDTHRGLVGRLAQAAQTRVLAIDYRLAPEYPFPAALEDALTAYRWLLGQGFLAKNIAIGGDSAGGGLTLATAIQLRDSGQALPEVLVLLSPWTDLTFSGKSILSRKQTDPIFGENGAPLLVPAYVGSHAPNEPLISPLFADLHGLPATLIHVGNDEILLDDSTRLEEKLKAAGVETCLRIWEGMWHVFPAFAPWVPEAQFAIDETGNFIQQKIA
jgi:monoterpene epsilon-lactone hydrolase